MDFSTLVDYFSLLTMIACLCVGYVIKTSFDTIPNKYIPTILAIFGAILNPIISGLTPENVIYGALMGLASTGMHQAFKQFIEHNSDDK